MPIETCPGCRGALGAGPREGLYACPGCQGRYVDRYALKALGVGVPVELRRHLPRHPRACAGCGEQMERVVISEVSLDFCGSCESLYFDAGELEALRSAGPREQLLECDGCGRPTPVASLESRDGKAICPACIADEPRLRATGISDRDYLAARRHASEDRVETVLVNGYYSQPWRNGPDTGSALLDVLFFLFR